jgi:uncharacterized protein YbjT (DUF2867 family)
MAQAPRNILVVGATGKQGGAVCRALIEQPLPFDFKILALTRNTTSASAKRLQAIDSARVQLVAGDLNDAEAVFTAIDAPVWAVFLVTQPFHGKTAPDGRNLEVKHGVDMLDAAIRHQVSHFIFSSVDRGGSEKSLTNATEISHFATKHEIELAIVDKVPKAWHDMDYTILRPVAFMDNLGPNLFGRLFAVMWADTLGDKPLQLIATKDIGRIARQALAEEEDEGSKFRNKGISIAGDELTQRQADKIFWKLYGRPMPQAWVLAGRALQWGVGDVGVMFKWFREEGYEAKIEEARSIEPRLMGLEEYLREESGFLR